MFFNISCSVKVEKVESESFKFLGKNFELVFSAACSVPELDK